MAQPTLDERFRLEPPTRGSDDYHRWMTADERRFVLWGIKEDWSAAKIARALGVNEATVRRFRQRFARNPELLLELGLFEMVGRARDDEYRCLVCGDQLIGRSSIERHVLRHFVDEAATQETLQLGGAGTEPTASPAAVLAPDALDPPDQETTSSPGAERRLYNRLQQPTAETLPPRQDQHTAGTKAPSQQLPLIAQGPLGGHDAAVEDVHSAPEQSGQPTERPQDATATSAQSTAPADRKDIQPTPRLQPERPQLESTELIPEAPAPAPRPQVVDTTSTTQQPDAPARVAPQPPADEDAETRRQEFELLKRHATDQGPEAPAPAPQPQVVDTTSITQQPGAPDRVAPQPPADEDAEKRRQEFELLKQQATDQGPEAPAPAPQPQVVDTTNTTQQPDAPARVAPQPPADEDAEKRRQEFELLKRQATDQGPEAPAPAPQPQIVDTTSRTQQPDTPARVSPQLPADEDAETRRQEFELLKRQATDQGPEAPAPAPRPQVVDTTSRTQQPDTPARVSPQLPADEDADERRQEFELLRRQATDQGPEAPAPAPQPQVVDTTSTTQQPGAPARVAPQPPADEDAEKRRQEFELLRRQATDQGLGGPPPPTRTPVDATPQTADSESSSPQAGRSAGDRQEQEIERLVGEPVMFGPEGKPGEQGSGPAGLNEVLLQMDPSPGGPGETSTQGRDVPDSSEWHHAFQRLAAQRGQGEEASKAGPEASSAGTDASRDTGKRGDTGQLGGTGEHPGPGAESARPGTSAPDEKASEPMPDSSEWHQAFQSLAAQRGQGEQWEGALDDQEPIVSKDVGPPKPDEPAAGDPDGDADQEWEDEL